MTIALWVAGVLAYLFIGGFLGQIADEEGEGSIVLVGFILLWPILIIVGFGMQVAKKVRE
jgi:Na+/pantothenate symporter